MNEIVPFKPPEVQIDRVTIKPPVKLEGSCGVTDFRSVRNVTHACMHACMHNPSQQIIALLGRAAADFTHGIFCRHEQNSLECGEPARNIVEDTAVKSVDTLGSFCTLHFSIARFAKHIHLIQYRTIPQCVNLSPLFFTFLLRRTRSAAGTQKSTVVYMFRLVESTTNREVTDKSIFGFQ